MDGDLRLLERRAAAGDQEAQDGLLVLRERRGEGLAIRKHLLTRLVSAIAYRPRELRWHLWPRPEAMTRDTSKWTRWRANLLALARQEVNEARWLLDFPFGVPAIGMRSVTVVVFRLDDDGEKWSRAWWLPASDEDERFLRSFKGKRWCLSAEWALPDDSKEIVWTPRIARV